MGTDPWIESSTLAALCYGCSCTLEVQSQTSRRLLVAGRTDLLLPAQPPGIGLLSGPLASSVALLIITNFGEGRTGVTTLSIV